MALGPQVPAMEAAIASGGFLESANVHGNFYGTSFAAVRDVASAGQVHRRWGVRGWRLCRSVGGWGWVGGGAAVASAGGLRAGGGGWGWGWGWGWRVPFRGTLNRKDREVLTRIGGLVARASLPSLGGRGLLAGVHPGH